MEVHSDSGLPQETRKNSNKQSKFTSRWTEREQSSRLVRKEIIKIKAKINEIEIKNNRKEQETESWFFKR